MLEQLKDKLKSESHTSEEAKSHHEVVERLQKAVHDIDLPEEVLSEAKSEGVSSEELIAVRRELMARVRELEDELANLKIRK